MNTLDKLIATFSPKAGYRRAQYRKAIRAYEAAQPSRLHKKRTDARDADGVNNGAQRPLRLQARHLDENYDIATGILDALENNIVGTALWPEPMQLAADGTLHEQANEDLSRLFRRWARAPDTTGELDWNTLLRLVVRSWLRDGEMFTQYLEGRVSGYRHNSDVPLSLELIESEMVPIDYVDEKAGIMQGIQKDAWGRPDGYWIFDTHPEGILSGMSLVSDTHFVEARRMVHLKLMKRIRQTRGITLFHAVLGRMDDIKDYEESERVAARVAAAFTAFITKDGELSTVDPDGDGKTRLIEMGPGLVVDDLMPGEKIEIAEASRPNTGLNDFRKGQLKATAAGTRSNASTISRDYDGTYSSQRQSMVEQRGNYDVLRGYLMQRFVLPTYERFVRMALLSGSYVPPSDLVKTTLYDVEFSTPGIPWIDPLKEVKADETAVNKGFKSVTQVIRERGGDPRTVRSQREREAEWVPKEEPAQPMEAPSESA